MNFKVCTKGKPAMVYSGYEPGSVTWVSKV